MFPEETIKAECEQVSPGCSASNGVEWAPPPPPVIKAAVIVIDGVSAFALVHQYRQERAGQPAPMHIFHQFANQDEFFAFERSLGAALRSRAW